MVQGTGTYQEHIGPDSTGTGISHTHHLERMLECSRSGSLKLLKKRIVGVTEFLETGRRNQVEKFLEQVDKRVASDCQERADKEVNDCEISISIHHIYQPEGKIDYQQSQENYACVDELPPAAAEIAESEYAHYLRYGEHHEKHHSVVGEGQERDERQDAYGKDHLVLEEGLEIQGRQSERYHVYDLSAELRAQNRPYGGYPEHKDKICEAVGFLENLRIGNVQGQQEGRYKRQRKDAVPEPAEDARSDGADAVLIFRLVGIQDLGDFGRDHLPLRDNQVTRVHEADGRRNVIRGFGMDQLGSLLVVHEVRDYQVIYPRCMEKGIHIAPSDFLGNEGEQLVAGFALQVNLCGRIFLRTLVFLDEKHSAGSIYVLVGTYSFIRYYPLGIDRIHRIDRSILHL